MLVLRYLRLGPPPIELLLEVPGDGLQEHEVAEATWSTFSYLTASSMTPGSW